MTAKSYCSHCGGELDLAKLRPKNFAKLPDGFVEHIKRLGITSMSLREIADEWERYQRGREDSSE